MRIHNYACFAERRLSCQVHFILVARHRSNSANHAHQRDCTLSNQVGDAAQSLQFLTEASKFAKATDSSLTNSVDLLSGALKSYNLSVDDAGKVSSIFFKTIDLGRVSSQSLGNTFGRVGPVAAQLGVSLEETGSAIAAISEVDPNLRSGPQSLDSGWG